MAVFILVFNVAVLIMLSFSATNDFLKFSAWALAVLFTISIFQVILVKSVNKK
jgi:hypothetical protein